MAHNKLSTTIMSGQSSKSEIPGRISAGIIGSKSSGQNDRIVESNKYRKIEAELAVILVEHFPGMDVDISHSDRWDRMCVTFRWAGFVGLLPEERFHRLVGVISEDFRTQKMAGFVWLELAPDESVESFLKQPRSEDVENRELEIDASLRHTGFYEALQKTMSAKRNQGCPGDFSFSQQSLIQARCNAQQITEARLLFIRHGAYCDCQVLQSVEPAFSKRHAPTG